MNPQTGQTALSIAQKLGYISVVETLKVSFDVKDTLEIVDHIHESPRKLFDAQNMFLQLLASSAKFLWLYF